MSDILKEKFDNGCSVYIYRDEQGEVWINLDKTVQGYTTGKNLPLKDLINNRFEDE